MLEQSVADALVATDWRDLAGRRALACSCRTYGARMGAWFARGTLDLEPHDCTEANAAFLLGPFYEKHPNTQIWTPDPEMAPDWHDEWIPGPFIAKQTLMAERRMDALFAAQEIHDPVDTSIMNPTMAFFVGRCLAKLVNRTALRFSWTVHRPDGSEHDEQHVISSHLLKTHASHPLPTDVLDRMCAADYGVVAGLALHAANAVLDTLAANCILLTQGMVDRAKMHVPLNHNRLDDQGAQHIARRIRNLPYPLVSLELANTVTPHSDGLLQHVVNRQFDTCVLTALNLNSNLLKTQVFKSLANALADGAFPALKELGLSRTVMDDEELQALVEGLQKGPTRLQVLDISHNIEISDDGLVHIANSGTAFVSLRELHMLNLRSITPHGYQCFANFIRERSFWGRISTIRVRDPPGWRSHTQEVQDLINAAMRCARAEYDWRAAQTKYVAATEGAQAL